MVISFDEGIRVAKRSPSNAAWRNNPEAVLCQQLLRAMILDTKLPLNEFIDWVETNTTIKFTPPIDITDPEFEQTNITAVEVDDKEFTYLTLKYLRSDNE